MILTVNSNDSGGGNFHNTMVCHDHPSWKIFWLRTFCQRYVRENNYGDHITENKHSLGDCDEFQDNFLSFHLLGFFVPLEIFFYSYWDFTITGEGPQMLTYARHLWPLSSDDSSACHAYCDKGHPFIMVITEDPRHSYLLPSVWHRNWHYLFIRIRSVSGIRTPNLSRARRMLQSFVLIKYQRICIMCICIMYIIEFMFAIQYTVSKSKNIEKNNMEWNFNCDFMYGMLSLR